MKKAWINEMVAVKKSALTKTALNKLKKDLTIRTKGFREFHEVEVFVENDKWLWLPRVFGYRHLRRKGFTFQDKRAMGPDLPFKVNWSLLDQPPYPPDQSILVKRVVEKAKKNGFGGFAVAPTASGKTLMNSYIGALLGGPTLIVVHKSDLIKNWRNSIQGFEVDGKKVWTIRLGNKKPRIGYIRGPKCQFGPRYPFVIATVQSLAEKDYPEELYSAFRTVLFDECHHLPATTFLTVAYKFKAKYLLGTTATLRRKDGTEKVFAQALGDTLYTMVRKDVQGKVFFIPVPFIIQPGRLRAAGVLSLAKIGTTFASLDYRNELIIEHVIKAYKQGRKNLVIASTRDHLANLFEMLPPIIRKRAGFYIGGRSEEELDKAASKQILFGTYGMAYEGMDVPDIDMLTLATPVKDVEQPVGRILRQHEDKMRPVIADFVDRHKTLVKWARDGRAPYYRREGFKFMTGIPVA